jgi:hypothetical protein
MEKWKAQNASHFSTAPTTTSCVLTGKNRLQSVKDVLVTLVKDVLGLDSFSRAAKGSKINVGFSL